MSMVGRNIDAFCARCGLTLAHIVLYEVGGTVQGVKCKTCGAEHRYHGPKPGRQRDIAAERRGAQETARTPRPVRPADARLWEQRNAAAAPDVVVWDYQLTERYEKGDVISPPPVRPGVRRKDHRRQHGGHLPGGPEVAGHEPPAGTRCGRRMTALTRLAKIATLPARISDQHLPRQLPLPGRPGPPHAGDRAGPRPRPYRGGGLLHDDRAGLCGGADRIGVSLLADHPPQDDRACRCRLRLRLLSHRRESHPLDDSARAVSHRRFDRDVPPLGELRRSPPRSNRRTGEGRSPSTNSPPPSHLSPPR